MAREMIKGERLLVTNQSFREENHFAFADIK